MNGEVQTRELAIAPIEGATVREFEDGLPRVRDLDLAEWLGYDPLTNIRRVIQRHLSEIEAFGFLVKLSEKSGTRGRPAMEYWLTEDHAVAVCQLSRGPQAAEVRIALRRLFQAYREGKLVPASPSDTTAVQLFNKLDRLSDSITLLATSMGDRMDRHEHKIERLEAGQRQLTSAVEDLAGRVGERRRNLSAWAKSLHVTCVAARRNGICPCCQEVPVCTPEGRVDGAEYDHWYGRWRNRAEETWLVCALCNQKLNTSTVFKDRARSAFEAYQQALRPLLGGGQLVLFEQ